MDMETIRAAAAAGHHWRPVDLGDRATYPLQLALTRGIVEEGERSRVVSLDRHEYLAVYDADVALSLAWGLHLQDRGDDARYWAKEEPWSSRGFPNPAVSYTVADLRWNGQPVDRIQLALVDSSRCYLPAPTASNPATSSGQADEAATTFHVTAWQCGVARLVDQLSGHTEFDSYLSRAGFSIDALSID